MSNSAITVLYVDGGCILSNPSTIGGTWAVLAADKDGKKLWESSGVLPVAEHGVFADKHDRDVVSNNYSELYAIIMGLEMVPEKWTGLIRSDSLISVNRARDPRKAKFNGIPYHLFNRLCDAVDRAGVVGYELLSGHPTKAELASGIGSRGYPCHEFNARCDWLCGVAGEAYLQSLNPQEAK